MLPYYAGIVQRVVKTLQVHHVEDLKTQGLWDERAKAAVAGKARDWIVTLLGPKRFKACRKVLGLSEAEFKDYILLDLETYIRKD